MSYNENEATYEMACYFVRETESAVLIQDPADFEEHWIPLSQIRSMHKAKNGQGTIVMTRWIARQKGLTK